MDKLTQQNKILKLMKQYKNGVPNYIFPKHGILRYSSRINELRKDGYNILTERVFVRGRATNTFKYSLIEIDTENNIEFEDIK